MIVAVVDGMGGGIGAQIVAQLRQRLPRDVEILALGTNAIATDRMIQAGANRGASGPNAIRVSINLADVIVGPIGVVVPNAMLGEITPDIAEAVACARGAKFLLPISKAHFYVIGVERQPLARLIETAAEHVQQTLAAKEKNLRHLEHPPTE
ncbi:MAG: DUF3842 family protein [Anaerolineae bacterium]|nr:DUF3842 family protein [Anaerolineae bacterium]